LVQILILVKNLGDESKKIDVLTSILVGILFSAGLIISGMAKRSRVISFLTLNDDWNPALAFVMGGAIAFNLPSFYFTLKMAKPLYSNKFDIPLNK